jgi:phosphatidylinositol-3-phosphatase
VTGPVRAAFYYPWFPEAWNQSGLNPYTHYHPSLGFYDGSASPVVESQIAAMQYAGLSTGIASWWGQGSRTDGRIATLLSSAAGTGFRWTLYYEPEGQGDPAPATISGDLGYIAAHYAGDPAFLHIGGKPVIFVYADGSDGCGMVDRWKQANTSGFYVVLKVFSGYRLCASQPDGWHQYGPASHADSQSDYSYTVSPGFWKAGEASPRLARDLTRFTTDVQAMAASGAQFQLVTTFNEWGEGTAVESAQEWATASGYGSYLDVLHQVLGGTAPAATPSATATPPASATATPSATATVTPTASASAAFGPCAGSAAPATWDHVIWVVMENHSAGEVVGAAAAPYETSLAAQCATATAYHGVTHPSLPNYLALTGGSTFGVTDDNGPSSHPVAAASIFSQVAGSGRQWRSYEESMPSNCALSSSGNYAVRHNPAAYFTGITADCARWDVPMGTTSSGAFASDLASDSLPAFSFVTPNLCNDMHNCSVATGDAWLQQWLPVVFASPSYRAGRTAVFVTFDEDDSSAANTVPFIAVAPSIAAGTITAATFDHYSLVRTTEEMLGLAPTLGSAAAASSMRAPLGV